MENQQTKIMGLEVETQKQCKTKNNYLTTHGNAQKTHKEYENGWCMHCHHFGNLVYHM